MRRSRWGRDDAACHRSLGKVVLRASREPLCSQNAHVRSDRLNIGYDVTAGHEILMSPAHSDMLAPVRGLQGTQWLLSTRGGTRCGGLGHSAHSLARGSFGRHQVTR